MTTTYKIREDIAQNAAKPEYLFLRYQKRWLSDRSQVRIAIKSRQIGISWTEAALSAIFASDGENGKSTYVLHLTEDAAKEWIVDVQYWANFYSYMCSEIEETVFEGEKDVKAYRVNFSSGHHVTALSSKPNNMRGKRGRIVIEEAGHQEDLQPFIKASIAFTMWGGSVTFIGTHNGEGSQFNRLIQETLTGKNDYSLHHIPFQVALQDGLYEKVAQKTGLPMTDEAKTQWVNDLYDRYGELALEELDAMPASHGEVFLPRFLARRQMRDSDVVRRLSYTKSHTYLSTPDRERLTRLNCERELTLPLARITPRDRIFLGWDFARHNDASALTLLAETPDLRARTILLLRMHNIPYEDQKTILFWTCDRITAVAQLSAGAIDSTGNGEYLGEVAHLAYRQIEQLKINRNWHNNAWINYRFQLQDDTLSLALDNDLLDSHTLVKRRGGVPIIHDKDVFKDSMGFQSHGDDLISVAIANYSRSSDSNAADYEDIFC